MTLDAFTAWSLFPRKSGPLPNLSKPIQRQRAWLWLYSVTARWIGTDATASESSLCKQTSQERHY